jgi:hypothetical protein
METQAEAQERSMGTRNALLGTIALICLIVTAVWVLLLIYEASTQGSPETAAQAVAYVAHPDPLFYLTYGNAAMISLSATMLFAGLYVMLRADAPLWAAMGVAFVPVYSLLTLFAYVSQITIVPRLTALQPESNVLLAQMVQAWPGSAVNVLNNLGYAVLGIPSIVSGVLLAMRDVSLRLAGILLALSGVASLIGMGGIVVQNAGLAGGSIAGGLLFLAALVPLSVALLREGEPRERGGVI